MRSKGQSAERADTRPRISRPEEAEALIGAALKALDDLEPLIEEETALFRRGKVRDALALSMDKNGAAQTYTRCLEALKSNAIAIGRFQPAELDALRARHEAFSTRMSLNLAVVATARTVSEGLLRELADVISNNASPKIYAPRTGVTRKAGTAPLTLSKMS